MKRKHILYLLLLLAICLLPFRAIIQRKAIGLYQHIKGKKTVKDRLNEFSESVHKRLVPYFEKQNIKYPPEQLIFVGLKDEAKLEIWASNSSDEAKLIRSYPILAASGKIGPKLKEGDYQVPEGIYKIESLNPNSMFHLSLRVNYPNSFDKAIAKKENRINLGGDIFIHGNVVSIGCLAMGDEAAEELFVLSAETGLNNIKVIISPVDFRKSELTKDQIANLPSWCEELYSEIKSELIKLKET
jgi:murein L,D-transpeptidase YafK